MKIAFSGSQCSGKTTLFNEISCIYKFDKFTKIKEIVRDINKLGVNINENGDDLTQRLISYTHLYNCKNNENLITDRCAWDSYVYSLWLYKRDKISKETYEISKDIFKITVNDFDVIFCNVADFDLISDDVRSESISFREEINEIFEKTGPYLMGAVRLSGSIQERKKLMFDVLDQIEPIPNFSISNIEKELDIQ